MKVSKTNALRILDTLGTGYEAVALNIKEAVSGTEAARLLGVDPRFVYKTLVTIGKSGEHYVFVIPAAEELDLKKAALAAGEKSVNMLPAKNLLPITGYVHGGCSPIGMKKRFPTFIDSSAENLDYIFVSGGRVGLQIKISPIALKNAADGRFAGVSSRDASRDEVK